MRSIPSSTRKPNVLPSSGFTKRSAAPKLIVCLLLLMLVLPESRAQQEESAPPAMMMPKAPRRVGNPALRYEVDAKRAGSDMNSDDALPRSREFIRIDSSYYVGWMYEGAYKYNHAADYLGFRNAIAPLERARRQMERDYGPELRTRTKDLMEYIPLTSRHIDYAIIVNFLNQCYLNTEQPDENYKLLRKYISYNFQREFFDAYNYLMWITHRNRFYTKAKYAFLGNSLGENEALSQRYLDSAVMRIRRNARFNETIYRPGYDQNDYLGVYHYASLLNAYTLKIDSAEKYFQLLKSSPVFPHNNYATFKAIQAKFRDAEAEYQLAKAQDPGDKRLQEWAYYTATLDVYKALPKFGELLMKDMIRSAGSTPGFGWYNIALARCLYYDGQISESRRYADRAAEFKELHIGTTLGQSHYDFSVQLNKLMTKDAEYEMRRFENRGWWYSPTTLGNMAKLQGERYLQAFLIINQFAQNPERDQVIYRLFSTESVISWDEVYQLISNFSSRYFIKRFENAAITDPRPEVRKYFQLMVARLYVKEGEFEKAEPILKRLQSDNTIDLAYEKLFLARMYQALAQCADARKDDAGRDEWLRRMYREYPQLVPFTGMKMPMQLLLVGDVDAAVAERLKDCNLNTGAKAGGVQARISFRRQGAARLVDYSVTDGNGNTVVPVQTYSYKDANVGALSIAYRLFGIGGKAPERVSADGV